MKQAKTTAVVAILVLAAALLLEMLFWGEGVKPEVASDGRTGSASGPFDAVSRGPGSEVEEKVDMDPERLALATAILPPWRLEGHVRDSEGQGISGAEIVCLGLAADAAITDEEGFYRFDLTTWPAASAVSFIAYYLGLRAWAKGFKPVNNHAVKLPTRMPDGELVLTEDLVLLLGGTVLGTVTTRYGEPVHSASVELRQEGEKNKRFYTADDGSFRVPIPGDGVFDLLAASGKHGVAMATLSLSADRDHRADLQLMPRSALRGQFVYPDGQPVAHLRVGAYPPGKSHGDTGAGGAGDGIDFTGPDGRFALEGLTPGEYRLFLAQVLDESFRKTLLGTHVGTDRGEERVVLPLHRLTIEVKDEHGKALHGGRIQLQGWRADDGLYVRRLAAGVPIPDGHEPTDYRGSDGKDWFVSPGTWWVISTRRGDEHAWTIAEASPNTNETKVELQFQPADLSTGLQLTVTDGDGAALAGFDVSLDSMVPGLRYGKKAEDGSRTLSLDMPPGNYHMWVYGIPEVEYLPHDEGVHLVAGQRSEIKVALVKGAHLRWTVEVPGLSKGDEISDLEVKLSGPMSRTFTSFVGTSEKGGYTGVVPRNGEAFTHSSSLRLGRYEVTVKVPGYQPFRTSTVLREGETSQVQVFLER